MSLYERADRTGTEGGTVYPLPVYLGDGGEVSAVYRPSVRPPEAEAVAVVSRPPR